MFSVEFRLTFVKWRSIPVCEENQNQLDQMEGHMDLEGIIYWLN
jgi:hypothetical protein